MTKNDFLNALRRELVGFSPEEIEDIMRDQEEYIADAMASGRTEFEAVKALGYPSNLARELKASRHLKSAEVDNKLFSKSESMVHVVIALCVLTPFNLIFVLGPFLALCGIIFSMWSVGLSGVLTGVALVLASFLMMFVGPLIFIGSFFGSLTIVGLSVLFIFGCYVVTLGFLKMMVWYLRKNLEFIQGK